MKKIWPVLLLMLTLCALSVGTAFALEAHTPINDELRLRIPQGGIVPNEERPYSVEYNGNLTTGSDVTFTAVGEGAASITMGYKRPWSEENKVEAVYDGKNTTEFTYHLLEPGEYYFFVNNAYVGAYTVTGTNLLAERVDTIMADCTATDDYGIALWAHDWLTTNTYYDSTTTYHGADCLLTEGWGVCQSYATAYYMMLESKGIDVEYISSSKINHAWNAVEIDGKWYEADVTWDTVGYYPYGTGDPSDYNHHIYFMLPDLLFQELENAHIGQPAKYESQCVSMDANYYVRSGLAATWLEDEVEDLLRLTLNEPESSMIQVPEQLEMISATKGYPVPKAVTAAALAFIINGQERTAPSGYVYELSAISDGEYLTVSTQIKKPDYSRLDTLTLPMNTRMIESAAFGNTAAQVVIIPKGITSVAEDAFENCTNLRYIVNRSQLTIIPPEGVEVIDEFE